jgi:SAM-dependent methyltransferase
MSEHRVSTHYSGPEGAEYFEYQSEIGRIGAQLNRPKFAPFVQATDVILDFGCGGGYLLAALPGARKIGVEPNPHAREVARSLGLEVHPSLDGLEADSVDVAISNHVLEHSLRPYDDLSALRRVLRPGGRLVLSLPLDDWRSQRDFAPDRNHHLYTWTARLLAALLREAGFDVRSCEVQTYAWSLRFARFQHKLPAWAFDALCVLTAILRRRRQLAAVAVRPAGGGPAGSG